MQLSTEQEYLPMRAAFSNDSRHVSYDLVKTWMSVVCIVAASSLPLMSTAAVTTVGILEKAGQATVNYPVTLSLVFKEGDVRNFFNRSVIYSVIIKWESSGIPICTR